MRFKAVFRHKVIITHAESKNSSERAQTAFSAL
uniref:Uncharacterized protein n=1 Tax=Siphoviridae sp. ctmP19 TaxID=2825651 RepID=A0A8S5PHD7_9CAUD|nr:MAG TPA: hypothetical protein [Siphoviridae sp. ctmP19]